MDRKIEKPFMTIKEWAVKHMEYVPRSSSTNPDGTENHDFRIRLLSGRLGPCCQFLMRHALSRSLVEHIRANLKIKEYEDMRNKKNTYAASSSTIWSASTDRMLRSETSTSAKPDESIAIFSSSSHISERSLLIKEYDETKHLLKKSIHSTQKATLDVSARRAECEELRCTLNSYHNDIEENNENLRFLGLLIVESKYSINQIRQDAQNLDNVFRQKFKLYQQVFMLAIC